MCINVGWSLQIQDTNATAPVDENSVGGSTGCTTLFLSCMSALQEEEIIKRSPRGKKVREILRYLEKHCDRPIFTEIAVTIITKLQSCIDSGNKYKLPSISRGCMWNTFHKLRNSDDMKRVWSTFVAAIEVPQPCCTCRVSVSHATYDGQGP